MKEKGEEHSRGAGMIGRNLTPEAKNEVDSRAGERDMGDNLANGLKEDKSPVNPELRTEDGKCL